MRQRQEVQKLSRQAGLIGY
ncbi:hypothetical protein PQR08_28275 [Caballeronia jiangsuensis]|uniref:Uncharacterized protein n=1 Tax=Caballeronia jiangsuensis TaxID=1458357 RepID=A0ABW9CVY9_9BURK